MYLSCISTTFVTSCLMQREVQNKLADAQLICVRMANVVRTRVMNTANVYLFRPLED